MNDFGGKIRNAFHELSKVVVGWDDILVQAMFGLCTKEHLFWLGPPGRAKTWVAKMIFSLFPDAKTFSIQVTKDMLPSAIFGSEIPDEYLKNGREIFNLTNGICDANLVYLDEFLDGPDFLVRSMNTVLNERIFERKDQRVCTPLHTGIMTTNFNRYGLALEAVRDRMMCKSATPAVEGLVGRINMYGSFLQYAGAMPHLPTLSFAELKSFTDVVESPNGVVVPDEVRLLHALLIQMYLKKRIEREKEKLQNAEPGKKVTDEDVKLESVTPRTEAKLHDFSRAAALLNDRTKVEPKDLKALRYGLIILNNGNGDEETWQEVCDEYLPKTDGQVKRIRQLATIANKIAELRNLGGNLREFVLETAGKAETYTKVTVLDLIDKITDRGNAASIEIAAELKAEIQQLGKKIPGTRFPWDKDW